MLVEKGHMKENRKSFEQREDEFPYPHTSIFHQISSARSSFGQMCLSDFRFVVCTLLYLELNSVLSFSSTLWFDFLHYVTIFAISAQYLYLCSTTTDIAPFWINRSRSSSTSVELSGLSDCPSFLSVLFCLTIHMTTSRFGLVFIYDISTMTFPVIVENHIRRV